MIFYLPFHNRIPKKVVNKMGMSPGIYTAAVFTCPEGFEVPEGDIYLGDDAYETIFAGNDQGIPLEGHETFATYIWITYGWEGTVNLIELASKVHSFSNQAAKYAADNSLIFRIAIGATYW